MAIAELHYAIFIAIKRSVATGRNWHIAGIDLFFDNLSVGVQTGRITALEMTGKPCCDLLQCGNLNSRFFCLQDYVIYASLTADGSITNASIG
jgi:hypothetical protein